MVYVNLVLTKIGVIKVLRAVCHNISLKDAKEVAERAEALAEDYGLGNEVVLIAAIFLANEDLFGAITQCERTGSRFYAQIAKQILAPPL